MCNVRFMLKGRTFDMLPDQNNRMNVHSSLSRHGNTSGNDPFCSSPNVCLFFFACKALLCHGRLSRLYIKVNQIHILVFYLSSEIIVVLDTPIVFFTQLIYTMIITNGGKNYHFQMAWQAQQWETKKNPSWKRIAHYYFSSFVSRFVIE